MTIIYNNYLSIIITIVQLQITKALSSMYQKPHSLFEITAKEINQPPALADKYRFFSETIKYRFVYPSKSYWDASGHWGMKLT